MQPLNGSSAPAGAPSDALPNIPWEDRPAGMSHVLWRNSRNPIIARDQTERANSIFNSAVVPFRGEFAGVFRVDDTTRVMDLHAGFSKDGVDWRIEPATIKWAPGDERVPEIQETFVHAYDPRVCWIEDRYYVTWCNGYTGIVINGACEQICSAYYPRCPTGSTERHMDDGCGGDLCTCD